MYSYIHIPFCESKCKYCRFASIGKTNEILIKNYISYLIKEIKNFKTDFQEKSVLLKSIYFWWWTPSILKYDDLNLILNEMKNKFSFQQNIEITLETTPLNVNKENIESWERLWINRISIWVQTLNQKSLKEIWREDKWKILKALELLRPYKSPLIRGKLWKSRGIKDISIDFIIWLPYVKRWETLKDIKYILKNFPFIKHISVYMLEDYYEIEETKNWFEKIIYPNDWSKLWIDEKYYLKEYLEIKDFLKANWFNFYEISNSAKKWYECKHNKSYWNHKNNVWFWLWAHSFLQNKRFANVSDFLWYYRWDLEYFEELSKKDIFLEKVLFSLRTTWLKKSVYNKLNQETLNKYLEKWYLIEENGIVKINDKFTAVIDKIILDLIS